jgi:demethylmenaquinone methyltransferase/2-methoxy-6-polyprenyl-1,4-benzoquinol methylase
MTARAEPPVALPGTRPAGADDEAAASRQVREMFSGIAPHYDLLNHLLSLRFDVAWRRSVARRFRGLLAQPGARVLDLCCGTGDLALALAAEGAGSSAEVIGADFAHPMLVRAGHKAAARSGGNAPRFLEADALALPFAAESFDLVTTAFGFRNLANYRAGLAEFRRVLRPGGSLAILEFSEPRSALFGSLFGFYFRRVLPRIGGIISGNSGAYGYLPRSVRRFPQPPELAKWMEEAGFTQVNFERWTGGIVALHTGRREAHNKAAVR